MKASLRKARKYGAYARITVRSQLAYVFDFLIRSIFLLAILYIFAQLWSVTYRGVGHSTIGGYTYPEMIWYLIVAESVILASPKLNAKVEAEVKSGDVGYQLIHPASYLLLHYGSYMGEAAVRLLVNLLLGGLLGLFWFGWGWHGLNIPLLAVILIGSFTVNFLLTMSIALCAFWVEETRGLDFVYNKLLFTIGGMLLPLELFPGTMRDICEWLPFQAVAYFTAKASVKPDTAEALRMIGVQAIWIAALAVLVGWIYRKGVKKLHVNGG